MVVALAVEEDRLSSVTIVLGMGIVGLYVGNSMVAQPKLPMLLSQVLRRLLQIQFLFLVRNILRQPTMHQLRLLP